MTQTDKDIPAIDTTTNDLKQRFGRDMFNDFDIDDPAFNENFFEILDEMVAKCPVVHSNVGNGYHMLTRQADVRQAGQDWRTFSSAKGYMPNRPDGLPYLMPEESDPPKHTSWRQTLNPYLAPKVVANYDTQIRADANTLIDRFIDRGECEFVTEFGSKLPGWAFFKNVLGVPTDDLDQLVQGVENGTFAPLEERGPAFAGVFEYLGKYLEIRSNEPPRGDLVDVIAAGVTYEDGSVSPWADRVSILVDLTFGGIATTTYVMAGAIHHLATHQGDRETLVDNPGLIERAVEEYVRVFPPVVALGRTCTRDVEIAGTQLKEGEFVLLGYGAASRDPRVVENPGKIDIGRDTVLHSAFGVGPHRCIGSNLARLELRATLEEWLKRIPDFGLRPGTQPTYETGILRTMKNLDLVF
jgi:cytochrome P450